MSENTERPLQVGDRVRTTHDIYPELPSDTAGLIVSVISNTYSGVAVIEFLANRGDLWITRPADLERIHDE